jgi:hypothetical protein
LIVVLAHCTDTSREDTFMISGLADYLGQKRRFNQLLVAPSFVYVLDRVWLKRTAM